MSRGLRTLYHFRRLLNPFVYGRFAWMLWSHKLARWLVFLLLPFAALGLWLVFPCPLTAAVLGAGALTAYVAARTALRWPEGQPLPRVLALPAFAVLTCAAGFQSWWRALLGEGQAIWEPTRR
jgi:hypothetical protein